MKKVFYNKLIRDKIPDQIRNNQGEFEVRELGDEEFEQELLKKINEEASALSRVRSRQEFLDELADLEIVVDEIKRLQNISPQEIEETKQANLARKGGFERKLFLHWSSDLNYKSNETPQGIKDK
ncbi:MAG TPA: nucleoside triphosphate pyrophosphohydrolase [Candidatus Paceibacterota bacterium]|nr:nucleoside triphosphate pyrophosphohydrolase [Candidatus Paceibacterota bacterium]